MSVRLSVVMEQLGSHWTDFHKILYFIMFRTSVESVLAKFFQIKVVEKIKTHFLCSVIFPRKSYRL
jgi:hypothetical protein